MLFLHFCAFLAGTEFCFSSALRLQYLRMLAVAYEKTQELARDLRSVGCGDLDVEGNYLILVCSFLCCIFKAFCPGEIMYHLEK